MTADPSAVSSDDEETVFNETSKSQWRAEETTPNAFYSRRSNAMPDITDDAYIADEDAPDPWSLRNSKISNVHCDELGKKRVDPQVLRQAEDMMNTASTLTGIIEAHGLEGILPMSEFVAEYERLGKGKPVGRHMVPDATTVLEIS